MANQDMTIAEQLERAAEALEQMGPRENAASTNGNAAHSSTASSLAPAGSLSAELIRTDGVLRCGRG